MDKMNRRRFLTQTSAGILGASDFTSSRQAVAQAGNGKNVLFIAVDDLNDWIAPLYGYPGIITPNLSRLAERTVTFEQAYCAAPLCNPSRAALMTGVAPYHSGVYSISHAWRKAMPDVITLPQHFMQHGYHVVGGGKIYHWTQRDPQSWHEHFAQSWDPTPDPKFNRSLNSAQNFDWQPLDVPDSAMGDHKVASWAINYLQQEHDRPFFLACGFFRPHLPWHVPGKYFDMYPLRDIILPIVHPQDLDDVPDAGRKIAKPEREHQQVLETGQWKNAVQGYLASITFVDAQIGRVLDALDQSPCAENTVILLWSDHGWSLGEKSAWRKYHLWEEANRTPLFISVPGMTTPGARCSHPVSLQDIYPTLSSVCGLNACPAQDGHDLSPLLHDPSIEWNTPVLMTRTAYNQAVRTHRWRYIRYDDGSDELYDHYWDPWEWRNLAGNRLFDTVRREHALMLPEKCAPDAPLLER